MVEVKLKWMYWISPKCDFGLKMAEVKWVKWEGIWKSHFHFSPHFSEPNG